MLMVLAAGNYSLSAVPVPGSQEEEDQAYAKGAFCISKWQRARKWLSLGVEEVRRCRGGRLDHPKWLGKTPLSRLVSTLMSFKPIFSILKLGARQVLISTAEKKNIPWREMTKEVLESDVYSELETIRDASIVYPDSEFRSKNQRFSSITLSSLLLPSPRLHHRLHECPETAIVGLLKEAFGLLRPGGTLAVTDQSDLPPAIFTLLNAEPFLDEYHLTDLEGRMSEAGFLNVTSVMTDPRHRTVTETVPSV